MNRNSKKDKTLFFEKVENSKDKQEEIDTIIWTVSGKVKEIRRTFESTKKNLIFEYARKHCFRETKDKKR